MTKKELYYTKQKILGATLALLGIIMGLCSFMMDELVLISIVAMVGGLAVMCTKKLLLVDDYFDEVNERQNRRL